MPYPKPVRVISDLHMGHPACRILDVEQLRPLFQGAGTVIFNGDTAELRSKTLKPIGQQYIAGIKAMLSDMGIQGVFLRGNHDPGISDREFFEMEKEGGFVIHGDCLFDNLSPWNENIWRLEPKFREIRKSFSKDELKNDLNAWLNYIQACRLVSYGDEARPLSPGFKKIRSALRLIYPLRRPLEIVKCWAGSRKRLENFHHLYIPEKKWVIIGHTHRPGLFRINDTLTGINTGGFLSVGKAWIVEISEDSITVSKIKEQGSRIRLGKTVLREELVD